MTKILFGYGKEKLPLDIAEHNLIASLLPRKEDGGGDEQEILAAAIHAPIGAPPLCEIPKPGL